MSDLRITFGAPDNHEFRLAEAWHNGVLLAAERMDVRRTHDVKAFAARIAREMPADLGGLRQLTALAKDRLAEAIRSASADRASDDIENTRSELVVVSMADVEAEEVDWFWPQRIARRKITLVAGIPGLGKTFLMLDCAARCSTGAKWPDCEERAPTGTTILLTCEDGLGDTIKPRLLSAGADCSKIIAVPAVKFKHADGAESEAAVDLTQHLEQLEELIVQLGDVRLIGIDPLPVFLGATDAYKNCEVRRALARLAALAEKHNIAILGISHLTKDESKAAINRTQGSIAFVAAARAVHAVVADKRDPTGRRRLFIPIKNNLGNDKTGLAFELTSKYSSNGTPCILYEDGAVVVSADEALAPEIHKPGPDPERREDAEAWLRSVLANGPRLAKEIIEEAREGQDIAKRTLDRAKLAIGVKAYREANRGQWWWKLEHVAKHNANEIAREELGNLGNVQQITKETAIQRGADCHIAKLSECGEVDTDGGWDPEELDAANRLCEQVATENEAEIS